MKFHDFLWVFPFLLFFSGYLFVHSFFNISEVELPNVIGKTLLEGTGILSSKGLNLSLLQEKEEANIAPGTILDQIPKNGTLKPSFPVKVVVSKKPVPKKAPDFIGKNEKEISMVAKRSQIKVKIFNVKSKYSCGTCFAQAPSSNEAIKSEVVTYLSEGEDKMYIVPNFKGTTIAQARDSLKESGVSVSVFHTEETDTDHACHRCRVLEQKPMAGSIVDLNKKVQVQLLAS